MKRFALLWAASLPLLAACDDGANDGGAAGDNARPVAVVDGPATLAAGEAGLFDAIDSYDIDGRVVSWSFVWGDDSPEELSAGARAYHTYRRGGIYEVVVSAIDDRGAKGSATIQVLVVGSIEGSGEGSGAGSGEGSGGGSGAGSGEGSAAGSGAP